MTNIGYLKKYGKMNPWLRVMRLPLALLGIITSMALLSYTGKLFTMYGLGAVLFISLANIGGNMHNELNDIEDDKENKPWRPLPSGELSPKKVEHVYVSLTNVALLSTVLLYLYGGLVPVVLALSFMLFAWIYNHGRRDVLGVACMSLTYAVAGAVCLWPHYNIMLFWGIGFFLFTFSFNLLQQLQDVDDDLKYTIPKQIGRWNSMRFAGILSLISMIAFLYIGEIISLYFIASLCVFSSAVVIYCGWPDGLYIDSWKEWIEKSIRGFTRVILILITVGILIYGLV